MLWSGMRIMSDYAYTGFNNYSAFLIEFSD